MELKSEKSSKVKDDVKQICDALVIKINELVVPKKNSSSDSMDDPSDIEVTVTQICIELVAKVKQLTSVLIDNKSEEKQSSESPLLLKSKTLDSSLDNFFGECDQLDLHFQSVLSEPSFELENFSKQTSESSLLLKSRTSGNSLDSFLSECDQLDVHFQSVLSEPSLESQNFSGEKEKTIVESHGGPKVCKSLSSACFQNYRKPVYLNELGLHLEKQKSCPVDSEAFVEEIKNLKNKPVRKILRTKSELEEKLEGVKLMSQSDFDRIEQKILVHRSLSVNDAENQDGDKIYQELSAKMKMHKSQPMTKNLKKSLENFSKLRKAHTELQPTGELAAVLSRQRSGHSSLPSSPTVEAHTELNPTGELAAVLSRQRSRNSSLPSSPTIEAHTESKPTGELAAVLSRPRSSIAHLLSSTTGELVTSHPEITKTQFEIELEKARTRGRSILIRKGQNSSQIQINDIQKSSSQLQSLLASRRKSNDNGFKELKKAT